MVYSTVDGFPELIESRQQLTSGTVSQVDTRSWTRMAADEGGNSLQCSPDRDSSPVTIHNLETVSELRKGRDSWAWEVA